MYAATVSETFEILSVQMVVDFLNLSNADL